MKGTISRKGNRAKITFVNWEGSKTKFLAQISGRVVVNMEAAAQFAEEQAKARVPVSTGKLRDSIVGVVEIKARGDIVEGIVGVVAKEFYGYFIEMGTSKMPAHPFLRPAVYENAKEIVRILREGR